jgi:Ca2+-binding RTX toxin-like protein
VPYLCLISVSLLLLAASTTPAHASDNATLIVYVETDTADGTFTFVVTPGTIGTFQFSTAGYGGVEVLDVPVGSYNLTETSLPANWTLQEVVCAGTAPATTSSVNRRASFTMESPADVLYCRFTNLAPSTPIPEYPGASVMVLTALATSLALLFSRSKKRPSVQASAILLSALLLFSPIVQVRANPDRLLQLGTLGDDNQVQAGTVNPDVIGQFGFSGNDVQYASGGSGDDVIIQNGGSGDDNLTVRAGDGNDFILQEPGYGDNYASSEGGPGNDTIAQFGKRGNDNLNAIGGEGNDFIMISARDGNDTVRVDGGVGDDNITINAGAGNDIITYDVSPGYDTTYIDGGTGTDTLTINSKGQNFTIYDGASNVFFAAGTGGSKITVVNVEQTTVLDSNGKVLYATFTLTTSSATANLNGSVTLNGALSIPKTGSVTLYWAIGSSGFIYHTNESLINGVFSRSFGFGQAGTWQFKLYWLGDATSDPAESNIVAVTVSP